MSAHKLLPCFNIFGRAKESRSKLLHRINPITNFKDGQSGKLFCGQLLDL